jgi:excinuclease ABC subunit B
MQRAIDETERRRARQTAHNEAYGIIPQGIRKDVADILEARNATPGSGRRRDQRRVAEEVPDYVDAPENAAKEIEKLEQEMFQKARDLEFEEAARIRDRIEKLKALAFRPEASLS